MRRTVAAVLFDKDGTLFDFAATWNAWARQVIADLSRGDPARARELAVAVRFDLRAGRLLPDSPVIAGTNHEIATLMANALPGQSVDAVKRFLVAQAARAPVVEAAPLVPLLAGLAARDLSLGVMTNDSESVARAHLAAVGVLGMFDFVAGADSGFGAKPDPAPLLAFCRATAHAPDTVVMVGDSTHDLVAGRAAGMRCVAVLTGLAHAGDLASYADAVLPNIGHLPDWLNQQG